MVSGPVRGPSAPSGANNQRESDVPSEQELGVMFDAAMKAQDANGGKGITQEEQQKFLSAMKDPEFRSLLNDYMREISDPQHRAETEQYLSQLESEQRVPEDKELVKPVPGFVVKSKWREPSNGEKKVFVNICSNGKLQPPSSTRVEASRDSQAGTSWNLPYSVGPERLENDKGGAQAATFDVCFHTRTLEMSKMNAPFRDMVVKVGLDAVEGLLRESRGAPKGELSRAFHILKGVSYKSGGPVTMCLRKSVESNKKTKPATTKKTAPVKPSAASKKDTLVKSANDTSEKKSEVIDFVAPNPGAITPSLLDAQVERTEPIMREVTTTKKSVATSESRKLRFQMIYRGKFELMQHMQSEHNNIVPADRNHPKELVIEIDLPNASSAKGIDLDVSETVVRVTAPQYQLLSIPLPYPVVEAKGGAKFDKKQHKLVITLPVKPPPPPAPTSVSLTVEEENDTEEGEYLLDPPNEVNGTISISEPNSSVAKASSAPPKEDEFRMFRETALMVANDPQILARKSRSESKQTPPVTTYDDMPPLEACSDEEIDDQPNIVGVEVESSTGKSTDGTDAREEPSAPILKSVNTPSFTVKETSACVSYLVAVPGIESSSVKLCFPSASSMKLCFVASQDAQLKEYELEVEHLPHSVRPETAEFDVATENMVVIINKLLKTPSSPTPATSSAPLTPPVLPGSVDPVIRFQNDLLYELD